MLFNIYINDYLNEADIALYADDATILSTGPTIKYCAKHSWFSDNKLILTRKRFNANLLSDKTTQRLMKKHLLLGNKTWWKIKLAHS